MNFDHFENCFTYFNQSTIARLLCVVSGKVNTVCLEQTDRNIFFRNIFYKTWAILMKFGNTFLNKFAGT